MKTKTKIGKQVARKGNREVVETIVAAKKNKKWLEVSGILAGPRKNFVSLNLDSINENAKDKETVVIPGKVLSEGEIEKKIKVVALGFSGKAKEKLEKAKISLSNILDEIKNNPEAKGVRILK